MKTHKICGFGWSFSVLAYFKVKRAQVLQAQIKSSVHITLWQEHRHLTVLESL